MALKNYKKTEGPTAVKIAEDINQIKECYKRTERKKTVVPIRRNIADIYKSVSTRINNLKIKCQGVRQLNSLDIARYRYPKFQIILTEMLMKGYHRSFSMLFNLNAERERKRQKEGPDSTRWNLVSIMDHPQLENIRDYLCGWEDAERTGDSNNYVKSIEQLIGVFTEFQEDGWIVNQFVDMELNHAQEIGNDDGGYTQALSGLAAGINAYKNDNLEQAAEHLNKVFKLAYSHHWRDTDDQPLLEVCSNYICQVFLELACSLPLSKACDTLKYLKKAHEISKDVGLKSIEAKCCFHLGTVFEKLGNVDMSISYFRALYEVSYIIEDEKMVGYACESMARCYEYQKNKGEVLRYLEKFVDISEASCDWVEYARACRVLGETYNRFGEYAKAYSAFHKSYVVTWCLGARETFNESKLLKGITSGSEVTHRYCMHATVGTRQPTEKVNRFRSFIEMLPPFQFLEPIIEMPNITFAKRFAECRNSDAK